MDRINVFKGGGHLSAAMLLGIVGGSGLAHTVAADPRPVRGFGPARKPDAGTPSDALQAEIAAWNAAVEAKKRAKKGA